MDEDALARFRRAQVGIVFQAFHLIPTMTALENVAVPLEFAGGRDAFERAARGAGGGRARPPAWPIYPGQLSGGEQQRVALARAFVAEPAAAAGGRADRQPRPRHRRGGDGPAVRAARRGTAPR